MARSKYPIVAKKSDEKYRIAEVDLQMNVIFGAILREPTDNNCGNDSTPGGICI